MTVTAAPKQVLNADVLTPVNNMSTTFTFDVTPAHHKSYSFLGMHKLANLLNV